MDYVRSNKGGMKLLFQNNLYVKQKVLSSGAVCWEFFSITHSKNKSYKISEKNVLSGGFLARRVFVCGVMSGGFLSGRFLS